MHKLFTSLMILGFCIWYFTRSQAPLSVTSPSLPVPSPEISLPSNPEPSTPPETYSPTEIAAVQDEIYQNELVLCQISPSDMDQYISKKLATEFNSEEIQCPSLCKHMIMTNDDLASQCLTERLNCDFSYTSPSELDMVFFFRSSELVSYYKKIDDTQAYMNNPQNPDFKPSTYWDGKQQDFIQLAMNATEEYLRQVEYKYQSDAEILD